MLKIVWLVLAVGIILVSGNYLIGKANIVASVFTGETVVGGCAVKEGLKLIPLVGYYSCEPQGYDLVDLVPVPDTSWYSPGTEWTIYCNYNMKTCTFVLMSEDGAKTLSTVDVPRGGSATYKKDSFLTGQRVVYVYGDPFALWRYSPIASPEKVNSVNCRLPSTSNLLKKTIEYVGVGSLETVINPTDSLDFNQKSSFLADWAVSPIEYNYYDGKYCGSGGNLYPTQTVELVSGCYVVPNLNTQPEKKLGCPGEPCNVGGRAGIVDNSFNCVLVEGTECSVLSPCPGFGMYNVDWNSDSTGKTAVKYSCVSGFCEPAYVVSNCASNSACPSGTSCQFNSNTGRGSCVAVGGTPIQPPPGVPPVDGSFGFLRVIKNIFVAMLVSGVLLFLLLTVGRFFAPLRLFSGFLSNPKTFFIVWIAVSLIFIFVFTIPIANLSATIFGGV